MTLVHTGGSDTHLYIKQRKDKMMKLSKCLMAAILMAAFTVAVTVTANAKGPRANKTVYLFGFASSFNDSTVYFTEIQSVDSSDIVKKTHQVVAKNEYSYQLKEHMLRQGVSHPTCVTVSSATRKGAEKAYLKMQAKYVKAGSYKINYITKDDFKYQTVVPPTFE